MVMLLIFVAWFIIDKMVIYISRAGRYASVQVFGGGDLVKG